jgi:hypothetical protein
MKADGGAAFPAGAYDSTDQCMAWQDGMTLRDYFAGQALATMTVASDYSAGPCNEAMARRAYCIADAMLAERGREGGSHE